MIAKKTFREIISWIVIIAAAFAFALIINSYVIVNASVPTGSMMDTIPEKSRVVAFRLSYDFSDPQRFDVVVFKYPDNEDELYVKRIIGMPGDTINIIDGKVYINGDAEPLRDDFVRGVYAAGPEDSLRADLMPGNDFGPFYVPEGHYFMMGDNRTNSLDSRYWVNKYVARGKILGKAVFCYFPEIKKIR